METPSLIAIRHSDQFAAAESFTASRGPAAVSEV
jgi:hypothetical protein